MRTVAPVSQADLTARARIRDAAIECFAEEGFDAPFRVIAERAGVSPALITHHFGPKSALREVCDAEVLARYRLAKAEALELPSGHLLEALANPDVNATLLVYLLRAVLAGGDAARAFVDHLIDDMRNVMAQGVASGLVRPSRDEEARLRYLTYQSIGALIVQFVLSPPSAPEEFVQSLRTGQQDTILPTLELFTEGVLADRSMVDEYVAYTSPSNARAKKPSSPTRRSRS